MKNKGFLWALLAVVVVLGGCGGLLVISLIVFAPGASLPRGGNAVAVIPVRGTVYSGRAPGGFGSGGAAYADEVIADLKAADENPAVRAIVLAVDSPGGSVVGSADIHRALKESSKPVVTSFGETAASGGYYIACATRRIVTRPDTLTGSIGVRWEFTNAQALLQKLGIEIETIKSGPFKDQGSPNRPLTAQERAMLQAIVDEAYQAFVQVVAEGRNLSEAQVRALADGRVFSGRQAVALGLADAEGNLDDAIKVAAELGGIKGEPEILRLERQPSWLAPLFGLMSRTDKPHELILLEEFLGTGGVPKLQYLYTAP